MHVEHSWEPAPNYAMIATSLHGRIRRLECLNLKEEEELCAAEDLSAEYGCGTAAFAVGVAGGKRST